MKIQERIIHTAFKSVNRLSNIVQAADAFERASTYQKNRVMTGKSIFSSVAFAKRQTGKINQ